MNEYNYNITIHFLHVLLFYVKEHKEFDKMTNIYIDIINKYGTIISILIRRILKQIEITRYRSSNKSYYFPKLILKNVMCNRVTTKHLNIEQIELIINIMNTELEKIINKYVNIYYIRFINYTFFEKQKCLMNDICKIWKLYSINIDKYKTLNENQKKMSKCILENYTKNEDYFPIEIINMIYNYI